MAIKISGVTVLDYGGGSLTSNFAGGYQALVNNTTGTYNSAYGFQSLLTNTTGIQNSGFGYQSLYFNTIGTFNSGFAFQTLYNNTTGVFTYQHANNLALALVVNAVAIAANQFVYIYAEKNTGSGWNVIANSGKYYELVNGAHTQIVYSQAVYRQAGEQTRYWIYSNDGHTSLVTDTLPGITSTVYVPAIRIQYS